MLLPAASQETKQGAASALSERFRMKACPNFAAEFLSGKRKGRRPIRQLELPTDQYPPWNEVPAAEAVQTNGCRITETGQRREKLRRFAQECSCALEHVYFGGEGVAQDRELLEAKRITHVVNCVRREVQNYFDAELKYLGLFLQDSGAEDIVAVLYDVFDFIEKAREQKGNVFVHCSQGVSRSAALVIAYVMWRKRQSFEVTKEELKNRRGIIDPNVNFCSQLIFWEKRFRSTTDRFLRIYRIASQSVHQPCYLVPKQLRPQNFQSRPLVSNAFDPRGTFVIHAPESVFIWKGRKHLSPYLDSARKFARQLSDYEGAPVAREIFEGSEPRDFFTNLALLFRCSIREFHDDDDSESMTTEEFFEASADAMCCGGGPFQVQEQEAFTADYESFLSECASVKLHEGGGEHTFQWSPSFSPS